MKKQNTPPESTSLRVPEQEYLAPILPRVKASKDYRDRKALLEQCDDLLKQSEIEIQLQETALKKAQEQSSSALSEKRKRQIQSWTSQALRCNIARILTGDSLRQFAVHLAESSLLQQFCKLIRFDTVHVPSKSTLQEYSEAFEAEEIERVIVSLTGTTQKKSSEIGLEESFDNSTVLMDSTCMKLNIHFPVDWVLLRDGVRTLTKAIECIRRHGLKSRIQTPSQFRTQMNKLCIAMSHQKRGRNSKKKRKEILRQMKRLGHCVAQHGRRYHQLLLEGWENSDLSEGEANQILKRIDNILTQLPAAIHQAHERIIGERQVPNNKKILSLYEPHTEVYHRGKAGSETEFGLQLFIGESMEGLILDWELVNGSPKNDTQHLKPCIERLQKAGITVLESVGDRGFFSKANSTYLEKQKIGNRLCPLNIISLQEKLQDKAFVTFQKRRAQTEARISILKHCFIGPTLPAKGMVRQKKHVAFSILTHNLWVIARKILAQEKPIRKAA
jgi:hypothetical protein